jgi:23S rRNA pseudouridine1911/1915/1917 synthase
MDQEASAVRTDALLEVVYEDENVLVVNKPAGLVVHPSKDGERSSLIGRVRLYLGHAEGRLVNRLDRETSGLVVVARSSAVAGDLGRLVARRALRKVYLAIAQGHVAEVPRTIDAPLGRDDRSLVAIKDCVRDDGAPATTRITSVRHIIRDGRPYSVLSVEPLTGRKHQIRIHLAHIGHPIVGDKIYGEDEGRYLRLVTGTLTDDDRRALVLDHHALHASGLAFSWRGREWVFQAPLPERLLGFAAIALESQA